MHQEECLNCGCTYNVNQSLSNRPMIYCSVRCELERKQELEVEAAMYVTSTQDEFIY